MESSNQGAESAKQREQETAMERVKRQQAELDEMRLKYTIYNQEKITKQEQDTLQVLLDQTRLDTKLDLILNLDYFRLWKANFISHQSHVANQTVTPPPSDIIFNNEYLRLVNDHAKRLKEEREQLLKSGVYLESDRIIQEINHQIKEICLDA